MRFLNLGTLIGLLCASTRPVCTPTRQNHAAEKPRTDIGATLTARPLDENQARRLAEVYAFREGALAPPVDAYVTAESNGEWVVFFNYGYYQSANGEEVGIPVHWSQHITVTPSGACYGGGVPFRLFAETQPAVPHLTVDSNVAILLARVFAEQQGLLPERTFVESCPTGDGGWLFAFYPETGNSAVFGPFAVEVQPNGLCRFVSEVRRAGCNP